MNRLPSFQSKVPTPLLEIHFSFLAHLCLSRIPPIIHTHPQITIMNLASTQASPLETCHLTKSLVAHRAPLCGHHSHKPHPPSHSFPATTRVSRMGNHLEESLFPTTYAPYLRSCTLQAFSILSQAALSSHCPSSPSNSLFQSPKHQRKRSLPVSCACPSPAPPHSLCTYSFHM